jgi:calmodulin
LIRGRPLILITVLLANREISYIMRYLLQFPSEAQVRDYIISKLEDDEPSDYIKYDKFEPYMLQVLMSNEFEPATAERLLDAFKILDPQGLGYVRKDVMHQLLTTKGIPLRPTEYDFFKQFAIGKDPEKIFYEDYVARLIEENERHLDYLLKGYENFKPSMGK